MPEYFDMTEIDTIMCGQCIHKEHIDNCREFYPKIVNTSDGRRWICPLRHKMDPDAEIKKIDSCDVKSCLTCSESKDCEIVVGTMSEEQARIHSKVLSNLGTRLFRVGEIVTNEKGAKQSKINHEWLDFDPVVMLRLAEISAQGKAKYGSENWRKISAKDHLNHALTHIFMHLTGDKSEPHLLHAICRLIFTVGVGENGEEKESQ